jgi:hypothetical protein
VESLRLRLCSEGGFNFKSFILKADCFSQKVEFDVQSITPKELRGTLTEICSNDRRLRPEPLSLSHFIQRRQWVR